MRQIAAYPDGTIPPFGSLATPALIRERILTFEERLAQVDGAKFGDAYPLKHSFAEGCVMREIWIPAGEAVVGKIHKHSHPNFLMSGTVLVVTEYEGVQKFTGPLAMISQPGTKRALVALTDVWWIVVHVTEETDLVKIEEAVIATDFPAYERYRLALKE